MNLYLLTTVVCLFSQGILYAQFKQGVAKGEIEFPEINEASGLIASERNTGHLWTHNDSGDDARIFLIDESARHKAIYYLEGVVARDWEDIGMMHINGKPYLLLAEIGDNKAQHPDVKIYRIEEPVLKAGGPYVDTIAGAGITTYVFNYEDGPRDAESLFFDPIDQQLYIISKRELQVGLYQANLTLPLADTLTLKKVGTLPHTFITAADISPDGGELLIKNLLHVWYWKRGSGETIPQMLRRPAVRLPYKPEPQGEAIAFAQDRRGYYTLSEMALGMGAVLYFYERE